MANTGLQNLREDYLYDKLVPEGIISLDERSLLRAVIGGIQDRLSDLRSYAKKYEYFFDSAGLQSHNNVVLVTFETTYGKVLTRSLDIQDDTPDTEGDDLTNWAADEMGVDVSQITSCVFGEDLLRFVDENTLQYLAATVGAVLYATAAQDGETAKNQQRILDSYFPRLKIKGTAQSFDTLGRLIGFEDVRMVPLWGRMSPRVPNDFGNPANDKDFSQKPTYLPQQEIDSSYDPHIFRDGPYYSWTGTASANPSSSYFYTQSVNGFQPWVQFQVIGSTVAHPAPGTNVTLAGGAPHTKASALVGQGLQVVALAEGADFNGLQVDFATWNNGTDRLVSITDRLSDIKYRTSYFDLAFTLTDQRAINVFGTNTARQNSDLFHNPTLTSDGTASSPYRPWTGGVITGLTTQQDFVYVTNGQGSVSTPRTQATVQQSQFDTDALQHAGQQALQVMEEVRPASRLPRRASVGYLDRNTVRYASVDQIEHITFASGTQAKAGVVTDAPGKPYFITAYVQGTNTPLDAVFDPASVFNGTVVRLSDGALLSGSFDLGTGAYYFSTTAPSPYLSTLVVDIYYTPTSTETIRSNGTGSPQVYQPRPEDQDRSDTRYESADTFPWRRDIVGGGELVEVNGYANPMIPDAGVDAVSQKIAVKDQTGADYSVSGVSSSVQPLRLIAQANPTDETYQPGQIPISYKGTFKSLPAQALPTVDMPGSYFSDLSLYTNPGFSLYHTGLVQGVLVADPVSFFSRAHRDGLNLWLPLNEHPDEGAVAFDHSVSGAQTVLSGFPLNGSFANHVWDNSVGWYTHMENGQSITGSGIKKVNPDFALSMWLRPEQLAITEGDASTLYSQGPLTITLDAIGDLVEIVYENQDGSNQAVANLSFTPNEFFQLAVVVSGQYVSYGTGSQTQPLTLTTGTLVGQFLPFNGTHTSFSMSCPDRHIDFQDLRVWNKTKTQTELNQIRSYNPVPTICTYWPTNIEVVGSGDHYGLKVLPNGFVFPDIMPPFVRMNRLARVRRYNDEGRYEGENRFNETGFGGGMPLPSQFQLGQQFFEMTSSGTAVFSTTTGQVPGYNAVWGNALPSTGTYNFFAYAGSTANGWTGTTQTVAGSLWPTVMPFTNPIEEQVWMPGIGGGVYEVTLASVGTNGAVLQGSKVARLRSDSELTLNNYGTTSTLKLAEQPTGAETILASNGVAVFITPLGTAVQSNQQSVVPDGAQFDSRGGLNVTVIPGHTYTWIEGTNESSFAHAGLQALTNGGTPGSTLTFTASFSPVHFTGPAGQTANLQLIPVSGNVYPNLNTPPLYMYLNQRTKDNVTNAWNNWTDNVDPKLFGNQQVPPVAALNSNDILEFENTSTLDIGRYRLTIVSGNLGQVDADFEGFNVQVSIDTVQIQTRLAAGQTGANFVATDVLEFELDVPVTPNWLLTIEWFNAAADPARGTARQMAIFSYKLEKIQTEVWQVSISQSGTNPNLAQIGVSPFGPTVPGGFIAVLNSYGTVTSVVHESQIYSSNDTVSSKVPMSSTLTSNTWAKREDHYVSSGTNVVLTDSVHQGLPTFSGIIVR